jgi:hypothetical protein
MEGLYYNNKMKQLVFKNVMFALLVVCFGFTANSQVGKQNKADRQTVEWRYELEGMGTGANGTYLVKVWSYSKSANIAMEQAKKNAVHGIIFKGFSDAKGGQSQKALARDPNVEQEKEDFFSDFFAEGGKYMKFVSVTNDGAIGAGDRIKVGKEYKVGVIVSVRKEDLRKDLEAAGIIKGLASGF